MAKVKTTPATNNRQKTVSMATERKNFKPVPRKKVERAKRQHQVPPIKPNIHLGDGILMKKGKLNKEILLILKGFYHMHSFTTYHRDELLKNCFLHKEMYPHDYTTAGKELIYKAITALATLGGILLSKSFPASRSLPLTNDEAHDIYTAVRFSFMDNGASDIEAIKEINRIIKHWLLVVKAKDGIPNGGDAIKCRALTEMTTALYNYCRVEIDKAIDEGKAHIIADNDNKQGGDE
ncbi:MAG: hypothetical protein EOP56_18065 [Sphingobacteriales bacterium]|nr:MAG: hypothetical protein EOP56_18065 [Sphingobacteriales bacterium]